LAIAPSDARTVTGPETTVVTPPIEVTVTGPDEPPPPPDDPLPPLDDPPDDPPVESPPLDDPPDDPPVESPPLDAPGSRYVTVITARVSLPTRTDGFETVAVATWDPTVTGSATTRYVPARSDFSSREPVSVALYAGPAAFARGPVTMTRAAASTGSPATFTCIDAGG